MKSLFLACLILTGQVGCEHTPVSTPKSAPAGSEPKTSVPQPGRFILYPGSSKREPTFLLDSAVGHLWVVSERKDHKSVLVPVPAVTADLTAIDKKQADWWSQFPVAK